MTNVISLAQYRADKLAKKIAADAKARACAVALFRQWGQRADCAMAGISEEFLDDGDYTS